MLRKRALVLLGGCAVSLLTACSPLRVGVVGVTVDDEGRPMIVVAWCEGQPPTSMTLRHERPPPRRDRSRADRDWVVDSRYVTDRPPDGRVMSVSLHEPAGWQVDSPIPELEDDVRYEIGSWPEGSVNTHGSVEFGTRSLATLTPGEIDTGSGEVSAEEFLDGLRQRAEC